MRSCNHTEWRCFGPRPDRCPITIESTVPIDLENPIHFEAEFEIPPFENCGLATSILNQMIPGPGNTFSATLE